MADDLKRVGLVFKTDGSVDFQKTLKEINASVQENRSAFKLQQTQWDKNTKAADKLKSKQEYLAKQTKDYADKVKILEKQLTELENAEKRDETAIKRKQNQLNTAKTSLNNYKKGLEEVSKQLEKGTANLEEFAKKTAAVGEKTTAVGKKMTTNISAPIAAVGVASTKAAMDFEKSMTKVSTIADETSAPISDLREGILQLSEKTGQSAEDLSEAMYQAISASVETGDAVNFLDTAVKAAIGGFTDNATAVDGLTSVLNAYGMKAVEVEKIANQMLLTQNLGKTTFGELAASIGQVTPIAAALGVTTEELFASLAVTTAQGLGTSQSITALKAAMSNIVKPSKEAGEAAAALGMEFSVSALKSKGWMGFLKDVRSRLAEASPEYAKLFSLVEEGTAKMTQLEMAGKKNSDEYKRLKTEVTGSAKQMELLAQANDSTIGGFATMFGSVEGLNSVLMLTSEQGMQKYNEAMGQMQTNTSALNDAYAKMSDTSAMKMQQSMNDIKNAGIEIGAVLLPAISSIVQKISDLVSKFSEMDEKQQKVIVTIAAVIAAIGPLIMGVGGVCKGLSNIITFSKTAVDIAVKIPGILKTIGTGAKVLWGILAANPIGIVIAIIAALVAAFIYLWNNCEGFREFWINLWEKIKDITKQVVDAVVKFFGDLWSKTKEKFTQIRETATNIWNAIKDTVMNIVLGIKNGITNGIQAAKDKVTGILDGIKNHFKTVFEGAKTIVKAALDKIKGFFNFKWSLPKLKMPHIKISGGFSLMPPKVPKFSISWYAKGGILNRPTIFGRQGDKFLGGGEAGKEAVLPIKLLKDYIREENIANNGILVKAIKEAIAEIRLTAENNIFIGDRKVAEILTELVLRKMNERSEAYMIMKGR